MIDIVCRQPYQYRVLRIAAFLLTSSLLLSTPARALGDSDRYLDGELFARRIARYIQANYPQSVALRRNGLRPALEFQLFLGKQVRDHGGHWAKLSAWLASRPRFSVLPHEFFQKCLELNGGNIELSLILAWDFLSFQWNTDTEIRNFKPSSLQLYDVTGELDSCGGNRQTLLWRSIRGDKFSAWYHFFGTAMHAFIRENTLVHGLKWRIPTNWILNLEETLLGRTFLVDILKRLENDKAGVRFGKALFRYVRRMDRDTIPEESGYLTSRPDLFGKSWKLLPGQTALSYGREPEYESPSLLSQVQAILTQTDSASDGQLIPILNSSTLDRTGLQYVWSWILVQRLGKTLDAATIDEVQDPVIRARLNRYLSSGRDFVGFFYPVQEDRLTVSRLWIDCLKAFRLVK